MNRALSLGSRRCRLARGPSTAAVVPPAQRSERPHLLRGVARGHGGSVAWHSFSGVVLNGCLKRAGSVARLATNCQQSIIDFLNDRYVWGGSTAGNSAVG